MEEIFKRIQSDREKIMNSDLLQLNTSKYTELSKETLIGLIELFNKSLNMMSYEIFSSTLYANPGMSEVRNLKDIYLKDAYRAHFHKDFIAPAKQNNVESQKVDVVSIKPLVRKEAEQMHKEELTKIQVESSSIEQTDSYSEEDRYSSIMSLFKEIQNEQ